MKNIRRVSVYVDGLNLYHPIANLGKPHLKWFNIFSYTESICGKNETLTDVHYFSAYPKWNPAKYARHQAYVTALEWAGCTFHEGQFKKKYKDCRHCGQQIISHEEKETDVNIAIKLVADAFDDKFERAIVISADTDLAPPINFVRDRFPKKSVFVIAPPNQFGSARELNPNLAIYPNKLKQNLLPEFADDREGNRIFTRPSEYSTPQSKKGT